MIINLDSKKEAILKKIFGVEDLTPIIERVIDDWAAYEIDLKSAGQQTLDDKISVLDEKFKKLRQ